MTLFTLLIVMAFERVVVKAKSLQLATIAQRYFSYIERLIHKKEAQEPKTARSEMTTALIVAGLPTATVWILAAYLPSAFVFFLHLLILWICIGCSSARKSYKGYLQAANRQDYEACSLYSQQFGNEDGDLSQVGRQLVFINYTHYASIIIVFVILGLPGLVFYVLCRQWHLLQTCEGLSKQYTQKLMFILDWLPSRISTVGFLLVGHFSRALPVWLSTFRNSELSAFEVLEKVSKASEDSPSIEHAELQEPLQMVKLVKRNIIFLLMLVSAMTLVGLIS